MISYRTETALQSALVSANIRWSS